MTNKEDSNVVVDGDDVEAQGTPQDSDYAGGDGGEDGGGGGGGGDDDQPISNEEEDDDDEEEKLLPPQAGIDLPVSKKLFTDKQLYNISLWAVRMAVLTDSINTTILRPNYPFMVSSGFPGAFPTTAPFAFGAAQYFVPLTALIGTAIAATFVGSLSDKFGRRPAILICVGFGFVGSLGKYFARSSFYAFCAVNFVTGLFGATLPVATAYASDVALSRTEKDALIGSLVAISMLGGTGGGIIAIAMSTTGLFSPLLVSGSMCLVSAVCGYFFLVEPDKLVFASGRQLKNADEDAIVDEADASPKKIDWRVCSNILVGSILDNAGSTGFIPFCLSPLAFNTFLAQFLERGELPLMSSNSFRWLSTLLALMIVPSAAGSNKIFAKMGAATACVVGNALTALATIILLQIANINPPTSVTYGVFFAVMYLSFPLTVVSQLSTGPMLDRIAPSSQRGLVQGLNSSVMQFGMALFPWVFGLLSDGIGLTTTLWICIGISFAAAVVNAPLMLVKVLQPRKKVHEYDHALAFDDEDVVKKLLGGEWVPPEKRWQINQKRMLKGHSFIVQDYVSYADEKANLCDMKRHAKADFEFYGKQMLSHLEGDCLADEDKRERLVRMIKKSRAPSSKQEELKRELGEWFADYMVDAGYQIDESPFIFKQLILSAFPRVIPPGDTEFTKENIEQATLNFARLYNHYLEEEENAAYLNAFAQAYMA